MSNGFDETGEAKTADILNIYLDFEKNGERLLNYLRRLKRLHGERLMPDCREPDGLLEHFIELVFPEGLTQAYYFSNTSLKKGLYDITIRPSIDGPRLERAFPTGLVLCVRGHPSPPAGRSPVLVIDRIVDVSDSAAKAFEIRRTAVPYVRAENVYRRRDQCLLTPEFTYDLPVISQETREKLRDWRGYIGWKKRIIENNIVGIRYLHVAMTEDGALRFLIVCENKDVFEDFRRHLRKDELMAFETRYSKDLWVFDYNDEYEGNPRDLEDFLKVEKLESLPIEVKNLPWCDPYVANLFFDLSEDDRNDYDELRLAIGEHSVQQPQGQNKSARDDAEPYDQEAIRKAREIILARFPKNGFLALSATGEQALIRRQEGVLKKLEEQSGYGPFLSSYLFDIGKANLPAEVLEVQTWHDKTLNPDQKKAVQTILSAPDLAMVQGPPGTGKTTVIAEAIYQFAKRGKKVLVASQANLAVDNVLEQLAETPVIRAVRLGRKDRIDERLQLTKDDVLKHFYRTIAGTCRQRYLHQWETTEHQIGTLERWIRDADVIYKDIGTFTGELRAQIDQRTKTQHDRDLEDQRLNKLCEKNELMEQQRKNLYDFKRFLRGEHELEFLLPESILDLLHKKVVTPLDALAGVHIDVNQWWHVKEAESSGRRSLFIRLILTKWQEVLDSLPQIQNDIARLQKLQAQQIIDPETADELDNLRKQIEHVQEAMIDDDNQLEVFRELKKRERILKRKSSGLDQRLYSRLFTIPHQNVPYWQTLCRSDISRDEAISVLTTAVKRIRKVQAQVNKALQRVDQQVDKLLDFLHIEPVEDQHLHRLDAELRRTDAQIQERKLCLEALHQRLKEKIQDLSQQQWLASRALPSEYEELRGKLMDWARSCRARLEEAQGFRTDWEPLLRDWARDLESPESLNSDQQHFLDTFIANCNVVGVTCNEKHRTLQEAEQTYFDVVIIDEVSKATPPELLMPMMLGHTTTLVGDHRQLPPLFTEKRGSWQEVVEEEQERLEEGNEELDSATELTQDNFERYQKMVTASLFKEHFENAPVELKTSLFYQYRMHPAIMDVINCFYENKLKCGLKDPDRERNHGMTISSPEGLDLITPDRHAIWIDTSRDPVGHWHFEQQSGTSKTNDLEAVLIIYLLAKIEEECKRLGYSPKKRKQVGVISFYGRQVRHIRRAIQRHERLHGGFEAIRCDVNTVDRFQGKERPIILVSMVRSKRTNRKSGSAYVAQFERINVALSRAQELLVVFGAKDMFLNYPVRLPNMDRPGYRMRKVYQEIINKLSQKACFWESARLLASRDYKKVYMDLLPERARAFTIQESRRSRSRRSSYQPRR